MIDRLELPRRMRVLPERANPPRGGYRDRAIEAVDRAIYETREGMAFAGGW